MFYYIMVVKWFYGSEYASVANHIYYVEWCGKTAPYMLSCALVIEVCKLAYFLNITIISIIK
jgi:hypothetical protein